MGQKYIVFTEKTSLYLGTYEQWQGKILDIDPIEDVKGLIQNANALNVPEVLLPWSFETLSQKCRLVSAAGGLVFSDNKVLLIKKNGFWDFPKGWIEEGEYPMQTAMREVREECGDLSLTILDPKPFITYHLYPLKKKVVLKKTYWYRMGCDALYSLNPQKKEGITAATFVPHEEVSEVIENSYPMIRHLWHAFTASDMA